MSGIFHFRKLFNDDGSSIESLLIKYDRVGDTSRPDEETVRLESTSKSSEQTPSDGSDRTEAVSPVGNAMQDTRDCNEDENVSNSLSPIIPCSILNAKETDATEYKTVSDDEEARSPTPEDQVTDVIIPRLEDTKADSSFDDVGNEEAATLEDHELTADEISKETDDDDEDKDDKVPETVDDDIDEEIVQLNEDNETALEDHEKADDEISNVSNEVKAVYDYEDMDGEVSETVDDEIDEEIAQLNDFNDNEDEEVSLSPILGDIMLAKNKVNTTVLNVEAKGLEEEIDHLENLGLS
jgi:hypothetical protein